MEAQLEILQNRLIPVFKRYRILKAIIFGSFARGEASTHSDLDLILVQDTNKRFFERYDGILADLGIALGNYAIDAFIYTPAELETISHRKFISAALREGRVIYESKQESS